MRVFITLIAMSILQGNILRLSPEFYDNRIPKSIYTYKETSNKIILKDSKDSNINFKILGKKEEKEDVFFGLIEIIDSDFKIKFASEDKEKISLNYQGCYKNKVCYPSKMKNILIKYDKKSISSVKKD